MKTRRVVLAGGSGFLGTILSAHFRAQGCEVVVLTRSARATADPVEHREGSWDGHTLGDWARELDGAEVMINLAGRSVDCRYHARNRRLMMDSRIDSTRILGEAITRCSDPPKL